MCNRIPTVVTRHRRSSIAGALIRSFGCCMMSLAFTLPMTVAQVADREVAELRFDRRFEKGAASTGLSLPQWITGIDQQGGTFYDEPASWQVPASVADGTGRLTIHLDRTKLAGDLATTFLFSAEQATDFAVQLFDAQGRVVVIDLFGNLVEISAAFSTNTFIIPLAKYPTATKIVIRHIHGAVAIFGAVLYPVATEGPMVDAELNRLARKLGDPLSPENPIVKNLQNITSSAKVPAAPVPSATATASATKPVTMAMPAAPTMVCAPTTATTMGCMCGVRRSTTGGPPILMVPPELPAIKPFKRALHILVEDSHGGTDMFNEYNFGSAQLARILSAQGGKVESTRQAAGFDASKGLTRELLNQFQIVIFNGRFNGRTIPFTDSEITAVSDWVHAGGGLLVTCASPTASDHLDAYFFNPLIKPFGIQFGWKNLEGRGHAPASQAPHPIVSGLSGFAIYHGVSVIGVSPAEGVAEIGGESAMMAQRQGKGRVVAFGAGSALQNQALNSRIINHSSPHVVASNTNLLMNLTLWLSETVAAQ